MESGKVVSNTSFRCELQRNGDWLTDSHLRDSMRALEPVSDSYANSQKKFSLRLKLQIVVGIMVKFVFSRFSFEVCFSFGLKEPHLECVVLLQIAHRFL